MKVQNLLKLLVLAILLVNVACGPVNDEFQRQMGGDNGKPPSWNRQTAQQRAKQAKQDNRPMSQGDKKNILEEHHNQAFDHDDAVALLEDWCQLHDNSKLCTALDLSEEALDLFWMEQLTRDEKKSGDIPVPKDSKMTAKVLQRVSEHNVDLALIREQVRDFDLMMRNECGVFKRGGMHSSCKPWREAHSLGFKSGAPMKHTEL